MVDLSRELERCVRVGIEAVREDPQHDLRFDLRCTILAALDAASPTGDRGRRRRGLLALLCVEEVHELWREARPDDDLIAEIVRQARRALDDGGRARSGDRSPGELAAQIDSVAASSDGAAWPLVGYAAVTALNTILRDDDLDPRVVDERGAALATDPSTFDTAFIAASACAGGLPDDPSSHPARRERFWTWWLTQGLQQACDGA